MSMKLKALLEQRNDLEEKMEKIVNTIKAENRTMTAEEKADFDNADKAITEIDETIDRIENFSNRQPKQFTTGDGMTQEEKDVKNLASYIRAKVNGEPVNANLGTTGNGAVISGTIASRIMQLVEEISNVYAKATKYAVKGTLTIPKVVTGTDDITIGFVNEFSAPNAHAFAFDSITLGGYDFAALCKVSQKMINNSDFELVNFVVRYMAEKLAKFLDKLCLVGDGSVLGIAGSCDASMTVTLNSATAVTADELIDIQESVTDVYQPGCEWYISKETRKAIRKLKDGEGNYLLQRDFSAPGAYTLLGKPVNISANMPALAANAKAIIYGDVAGLAVKEATPTSIQVLNERYADENAVGIKLYGEIDAKIENAQKIAMGVCAAS